MLNHDASPPAAKRVAPPEVEPVTLGPLRIAAVHWGKERGLEQNGGYIEAFDSATGSARWLLRIYAIAYRPDLEDDVQDIFIEKLRAGPRGKLTVIDEQGRRFVVDPGTQSVTSG